QAHKKKREEIIGHSIAEILGRKVFKDVIKKNIDTCFAGKSVRYETWFDFVGSGKKYMDVSYYPYFDENNKVSGVIVDSRDITERKQMEEALRENEAQKQAILDGISSNIAFVNEKLEILWVNKVAADSVGQSRTEMLGQTCYSLWADPEKPCAGCPALKTFQTKKSEHKIMHTPDGRVWDESGEPVFDFTGKLIGVIEIAHDITERTNAEKLLRKSEKKYRDLFEKSKDAILIIHNGKFIDCNQAAINMLRYNNKNEFLNTHPSELSPERQPDGKMSFTKANEMMKIAYENGSHRFEWDHKKFDGEVFSVEVLLTAISTDEKNQILHTVWRDITERKQAEEALKESEEKYRLIVENAHDGIEITQNNQIIFTNARFAEMLGYTIDELTNTPFNQVFTKQSVRETYERENSRKAGKPVNYQYEATMLKKDGTIIDVDVKYEIIDYKNKPATFAIIRNITERKKIEEKIKKNSIALEKQFEKSEKQRISTLVILNDLNKTTKDLKAALEKAKESDRLKSAFLANMSHEIR
ncbi:MAG: PAS domain S-box protein, partial [Candidatus Marinimicrobia bacterium]|nr:PAS domain S-box protein [Candidatus Neomarinimicrobiota bacterium]